MPLNTNIPLAVQVPAIQSSQLTNIALLAADRKDRAEEMQLRRDHLELGRQAADRAAEAQDEQRRLREAARTAIEVRDIASSGNAGNLASYLAGRKQNLVSRGVDTTHTDRAIQALQQGGAEAVLQLAQREVRMAEHFNVISRDKAQSPIGALRADLTANRITQDDFNAVRRKLTRVPSAGGGGQANTQFGPGRTFKDNANNLFFATSARDPRTGTMRAVLAPVNPNGPQEPVGGLTMVDNLGLTASERPGQRGLETGATEAAKIAQAQSAETFKQLRPVRNSIGKISEAITAIDAGANTGTLQSRLPSFTDASKRLDQIQRELGLNVIANTTFGALSDSELRFALDTALPTNMEPAALRQWLIEKRSAQQKLAAYLEDVAIFLGTPGNTVASFLGQQRGNPTAPEVIRFDQNGNRI